MLTEYGMPAALSDGDRATRTGAFDPHWIAGVVTSPIVQSDLRNHLLRALAADDFERLRPGLVRRSVEQGEILEAPGKPVAAVHFPDPGVLSVVARSADGTQAEAGLVGPEGMTGLALLNGVDGSPHSTLVQVSCRTLRIEADALRQALAASPTLHAHLLRYAQVFAVQVAQCALCNARFTIAQRLARWLLMCHDRVDREDLPLTHELLALMLGVRRAGVTTSLHDLERAGGLTTRRGGIRIRDRSALLAVAGASYGVPEAEYARIFG
jgi:CRP-like cAMP-binding protein